MRLHRVLFGGFVGKHGTLTVDKSEKAFYTDRNKKERECHETEILHHNGDRICVR